MKCTVTEVVAKFATTKAAPSTQKIGVRKASRVVRLDAAFASTPAAAARRGGLRNRNAWGAMVAAPRMTASETRASRQPCRSRSHVASGTKMVLARPAASVRMRRARARLRANHPTRTANAGSYRVAASTRPKPPQIA